MFTVLILNNLLLGNDSYLLFLIFQISSIGFIMPKKWMRKELVYMQGSVICINSKTAKHIFCIRKKSVFECPSDSLGIQSIQEV